MRIVVVSPPKMGNHWIKYILAEAYQVDALSIFPEYDYWGTRSISGFESFVKEGLFKPNSIFHQHFWPTLELCAFMDNQSIHAVTILRDPYDSFVSLYHYVQNFADSFLDARDPAVAMIGKPLNDPEVLGFLKRHFPVYLEQGIAWMTSGISPVIRYEALETNPVEEVRCVTDAISPISDTVIERAIEASRAHVLRERRRELVKHILFGRSGEGRRQLGAEHFAVMRPYAPLIQQLGYTVR